MGIKLGPFLCKPSTSSMGFWISTDNPGDIPKCSVRYWQTNESREKAKTISFAEPTKHYSTSIAIAPNLDANTRYSYEVLYDNATNLFGLPQDAFTFTTLSEHPDELEILLMSCHGIEAYQQASDTNESDTWNMWHKLLAVLKERPNCRIGLLGGDQVYMDDTFGEDLSDFKPLEKENTQAKVYDAYLKYWTEPVYREVMARIPCFLMWDDHDIIDGWGSREEQFSDKESERKRWEIYGETLRRAFDEMQASRNLGALNLKNGFSFLYKMDKAAIIGLDLRNTRGRIQGKSGEKLSMLSDDAKEDIRLAIEKLDKDVTTLFVLSPVTVARMGGSIEFFLGSLSNFMWHLMKWFGYGKTFKRMFIWTLIFSVCYLILYFDFQGLGGSIQSVASLLIMTIFLGGNWSNLARYFPRGHKIAKGLVLALILGILLRLVYVWSWDSTARETMPGFIQWTKEQWNLFWSTPITWIRSKPIDAPLGLELSLLTLFYFGLIKSKSVHKRITSLFKLNKSHSVKLAKFETIVGVLLLVALVIFNWWRGLPEENASWAILSYAFFGLLTFITFGLALLEATGTIDVIAGLNDDILDGWSADEHQDDLRWLIHLIQQATLGGARRVHLLCGDIHTGGLSTITFGLDKSVTTISQITSSPISYVTMPALAEKLTTGIGKTDIIDKQKASGENVICSINNIFFRSNRNFVILNVKKERVSLSADFYFEDLQTPVSIHI